jgi:dipeptide/tripeptide permease
MAKRLLLSGVIVLTASLAFGAVFWVNNFELVPVFKLTVTCLIWLGYLTVFILRTQKKLATRRHAIATIVLFILAIASLWSLQSARDSVDPPAQGATIQIKR